MQTTAQSTAQSAPAAATMRIKTQRLGFGDVLAEGWRHYWHNFWRIVLIILCVYVPITIITALVPTPNAATIAANGPGASIIPSIVSFLTALVAIIAVLAIAKVVEDSVLGKPVSAGNALWHGLTRWPAALGSYILLLLLLMVIIFPITILFIFAAVVLGVIVSAAASAGAQLLAFLFGILGVIVFVVVILVPVIAIMVYLGFYPYANSLRRQGPLGALGYSKNLVSRQALRVFGYELGIGILSGVVIFCVFVFAFVAGLVMGFVPDLAAPVKIILIVVQLIGSIVGSLFTVMLIVFFLNLDYLKHPAPAVVVADAPEPFGDTPSLEAAEPPPLPPAEEEASSALPPAQGSAVSSEPPASQPSA